MLKKILKKFLPNIFIKIIKNIYGFYKKKIFERNLLYFKKNNNKIKIIIGSGSSNYAGWLASDLPFFDISNEKKLSTILNNTEVDCFLAEHVFEHLSLEEGQKAILNLKKYLKKGGYFRIAVPDGFNPDPNYISYVAPNERSLNVHDHKILYTYKKILKLFDDDFKIHLHEYFDENNKFCINSWHNNEEYGFIYRSRYMDKRNTETKINYNSIILDAFKN